MDSFWDFFWFIISFFLLVAYLMVLFQIVIDLFRDHTVGGGMKALWVVGLIFLPILTAVIYLIARAAGWPSAPWPQRRRTKAGRRVHPLGGDHRPPRRRTRSREPSPSWTRAPSRRRVRAAEGQGPQRLADDAVRGRGQSAAR